MRMRLPMQVLMMLLWCVVPARAASGDPSPAPSTTGRIASAPPSLSQALAEADSANRLNGRFLTDRTRIYLSWNAPWGRTKAASTRMPQCRDSSAGDTLYLCVRFGRPAPRFTGFTATLLMHATGADTLAPWWSMESKGGANPGAMKVEWAAGATWAQPQPFNEQGQGAAVLDHDRMRSRLRLVYAVPFDRAASVAGDSVYCLARIVIGHRNARRVPGCDAPVVIEWNQASLAFGLRDESGVSVGERWVSFSGPFSLVEGFRGPRVKPWTPGGKRP